MLLFWPGFGFFAPSRIFLRRPPPRTLSLSALSVFSQPAVSSDAEWNWAEDDGAEAGRIAEGEPLAAFLLSAWLGRWDRAAAGSGRAAHGLLPERGPPGLGRRHGKFRFFRLENR